MKYEKGKVNNHFIRYIGTVSSIPLLFYKSLGDRKKTDLKSLKNSYIIFNSAPVDIDIDLNTFSENFEDTKIAFEIFKGSNFKFYNIDWIENHQKFLWFLNNLDHIKTTTYQYMDLDLDIGSLSKKDYLYHLNNCLHVLYMRSFRDYNSVVRIRDYEGNVLEDYVGRLYAKLNQSFCILPFIHLQYKPTGQSKLCCRFDLNAEKFVDSKENLSIQKSSLEETFKSSYWRTSRNLLTQNKKLPGCHKCYKEESGDNDIIGSMRLGSNVLYNEGFLHKFADSTLPKLKYLEIGFGNYCNMACLSCNSTLSTTWHDDEIKLNALLDRDSKIKRIVFKKLDNLKFDPGKQTLEDLELIKFTGGEPMINPEFNRFIDKICREGYPERITLEIYTNCSYIPSEKLTKNLTRFKTVLLNLSIDAFGEANNYIRYGSVWISDSKPSVSKSLDYWLALGKDNSNIRVVLSGTLSLLNIFEMPKFIPWWMDKFKTSGNEIVVKRSSITNSEYEGFFKLQPAFDPSYLDPNILPKDYYRDIQKWIDDYKNQYLIKYPEFPAIPESLHFSLIKLENIISKAEGDKEKAAQFLEYISKMDQIRNQSLDHSLPELALAVRKFLSQ